MRIPKTYSTSANILSRPTPMSGPSASRSPPQPQIHFTQSWSDSPDPWTEPSNAWSSSAVQHQPIEIETAKPEQLAFTLTNVLPPPYFENDFTRYLDELLLAVLRGTEDQLDIIRYSEDIHQDSQRQAQMPEWETSTTPAPIRIPFLFRMQLRLGLTHDVYHAQRSKS